MCQVLHKSEKSLDFVKIMGLSPVLYLLHFVSVGMDACVGNDVAKAVHPLQVEVDFLLAQVKPGFPQLVEDLG